MESALKAALRRLCALHGWLYGVFLQADPDNNGLLAPVEIYYEERTPAEIINALRRVHRLGEGTFSKLVLSRGHRWISSDAYFLDPFGECGDIPELKLLFLAGIKTIPVVSLLPFGAVLFGSTLKVPETLNFINQIRHSFRKLGNSTSLLRGAHQNSTIREGIQEQVLTSLILPGNLHEDLYRTMGKPALTFVNSSLTKSGRESCTVGQKATLWGPSGVDPPNSADWELERFLVSSESGNLPGFLPLSSLDVGEGLSSDFDFLDSFDFDLRRAFLGQPLWGEEDLKNVIGMCGNEENFPEKGKVSNNGLVNSLGPELISRPLTPGADFGHQFGESSVGKGPKKRARPGESTRPRPRDRQQIQDRVKELREIVPNGSKCSIDALLARTVNHMLFLQGVIKYADKIKQTDEPKMISEESGIIMRDSQGGATWAYEVAGQTIICPASIQEVNPHGQMLIEILCENHGSFLEIAESIRGLGLTILKGVMEARNRRILARFLVEANRSTNRMDIFLHLVQLLGRMSGQIRSVDCGISGAVGAYQQSLMAVASGAADRSR